MREEFRKCLKSPAFNNATMLKRLRNLQRVYRKGMRNERLFYWQRRSECAALSARGVKVSAIIDGASSEYVNLNLTSERILVSRAILSAVCLKV